MKFYQVFFTVTGAALIAAENASDAKEKFNLMDEKEVYEQCDPGNINAFEVTECDENGFVIES